MSADNLSADVQLQLRDAHRLYDEPEPDMTLRISFETAVWIANSLPREDGATKALKRLIRLEYEANLGLEP